MTQWQPIESAPKDGTKVDLWTFNGERWCDCWWHKGQEAWASDWSCQSERGFVIRYGQPTHWMPLPAPPEHD